MKLLVFTFILLAGIGFIAGLAQAVRYSIAGTPEKMSSFSRQIVTTIGGVLATNLGARIGIEIMQAKANGFEPAVFLLGQGGDTASFLQLAAAYLYVAGLVYALWGWSRANFSEDPKKVVVVVPQLSQTLLGVVVGVLTVALGVDAKP